MSNGVSAGASASETSSSKVVNRLQQVSASLALLRGRVTKVGNDLWGARPTAEAAPKPPAPQGVLGLIDVLDDQVQALHKELDRF